MLQRLVGGEFVCPRERDCSEVFGKLFLALHGESEIGEKVVTTMTAFNSEIQIAKQHTDFPGSIENCVHVHKA